MAQVRKYKDIMAKETMSAESQMYVYATERVADYYSKIDLTQKSVLTIVGSGDQMLNAYFFGAQHVTCFDINRRSPLFAEFKLVAIRGLSYEEFLSFFGETSSSGTFQKDLYQKLRVFLQEDIRVLFDRIIEGGDSLRSEYFRERSFIGSTPLEINAYLKDESSYMKMKRILHKAQPTYMLGDIRELVPKLDNESFDVINLSNVLNYLVGRDKGRISIMTDVLSSLARTIKKDGIIFFYSYSPTIYEDGTVPPASSVEALREVQNIGLFEIGEATFTGTNGKEPDKITILRKL